MTSLKKQTVSGVKWLVGSSFLQKAITFSATIVLARILTPSVFGLFSLAFVAIDALGLFKSMGFDSALIRRKEDTEKAANTAFFVIPLLGLLLYLILSFAAPAIGRFFDNQELVSVVRALGIIFVISCFGKVPAALLEKNMQFKKVSIAEVSSALIYAASAIALALLGFGIWSLVFAYILKTVNQNILVWYFAKWRPKFEFDRKVALEMFHFGKFLFLGGVIWFLKANLDNLLVGKILGVTALGFYAIAFSIANFCSDYLGSKVNRVIFPAYSRLQENLIDLKKASLKTLKFISIIVLPFGLGLSVLGTQVIGFFYGPKWIEAGAILRILVIAGIFNTLPVGLNAIFLACGKPKLWFWINLLQVFLFFVLIAPMAKLFGVLGVAMVVSMSSFIAFCIALAWAMQILAIKISEIYEALKPALFASLIMIAVLLIAKIYLTQLFIFILMAWTIYALFLYKTEKNIFKEIMGLIFHV